MCPTRLTSRTATDDIIVGNGYTNYFSMRLCKSDDIHGNLESNGPAKVL